MLILYVVKVPNILQLSHAVVSATKRFDMESLLLYSFPKSLLREAAGRAIAQAVSRRLPTAAARVRTRVWSCAIF
jgi:hypothetical protein